MKVKVISLPYIFQVLYVLCFTRSRYQVSVYRTIGPLVSRSDDLISRSDDIITRSDDFISRFDDIISRSD